MRLDVKAFGLACGILWGASLLIMGIVAMITPWAVPFVLTLGKLYIGYKITILGSIIGAIWGFVDAGICGVVIAWLYNIFAKK